ncbi:hypothetical protein TrLO_g11689 [Triparma laevis f. longispina]|uniref:Uncharacterized protein n=1 Tax=Triparma laevis f. longispina TaxID=1714387 RepID=A0A9W7F3I1_9STRA|nr:hypothetical protein TrLO_g11689 [Triparma laevis f. longispina]
MLPRLTSHLLPITRKALTSSPLSPSLRPFHQTSFRTFPVKSHKPKHEERGKKHNFIKFFGGAVFVVGLLLWWTDDHYDDYIESVSAKKANETDKADLLEQEKKDEQEWREREEGNA